jgi:DNA-binding NarL/FixJ family response regulator
MSHVEYDLKVLFIDDEPLLLDLLKRIINNIDPKMHIEVLSDPTKAIELVLKNNYDCIVLDQKMPGVSGKDIIKMIKQVRDIPCIIYTGFDVSEVTSDADVVMQKILNANFYPELINTIRQTVRTFA